MMIMDELRRWMASDEFRELIAGGAARLLAELEEAQAEQDLAT
jgi:hypothetical protein